LESHFHAIGSSITSDLELSLMFFAKRGFVANFNQILVSKPSPGQYVAGKGGNSALFGFEKARLTSRAFHLQMIC
jgi:hypothetical protein